MQHVEVTHEIAAPLAAVWARYTDHLSWSDWAGLGKVALARSGSPTVNGVGCVRSFNNFGFEVQEEVLSFEPPHRMTYRLSKGAVPMKDHLGEVSFEATGKGTRITWRCRFKPMIPLTGGLMQRGIMRLFRNALIGLERDLAGQ